MLIIIGTFEHSTELEILLGRLENKYIERKNIMVVPMDVDPENPYQMDSKKHDIYYKATEVGIACATASSIVGASVGFVLKWGPVFWGFITSAIGFALGFDIYIIVKKLNNYRNIPDVLPEVTIMVQCQEYKAQVVIDEMWKYSALTVGKYNNKPENSEDTTY